ncbi:MAG: hypothetical protein LUH18_08785 [Oscillospiraceae bacterium]|nr:hypothetical protein [Oscillospiraceae bacterium]
MIRIRSIVAIVLAVLISATCLCGCGYNEVASYYFENEYLIIEFTRLKSYTNYLNLEDGDVLRCVISCEKGTVSLTVEDEDGGVIFSETKISDDNFDVEIPSDGKYYITVTGKNSNGNAAFERIAADEIS